jgi:hypothetical protein
MPNVINGTSTGSGGLITTGDDSGILNIQTNETTAMSIDASQSVDFTNNIDAPNTFGFKNRLINSGMVIDQRNAGASVNTNGAYPVDRFVQLMSGGGVLTSQQSSTAPTDFINSIFTTVSTADASIAAGDYYLLRHAIEGLNVADLNWGATAAAAGKTAASVTLSFKVRSSVTGTFSGALENSAEDRSYPFTYSIASANTWTNISITIAGDTSGTWLTTNGVGIYINFNLGTGSTRLNTANAWVGAQSFGATGSVQLISTVNATFYITGVQLEKGTQATSFDFRDYGRELILCQRYFFKITGSGRHAIAGNGSVASSFPTVFFPVTMKTTPSFGYSALSDFYAEAIAGSSQAVVTGLAANATTTQSFTLQVTTAGSGTATGAQLIGTGGGASSWTSYSAEL